ncbi:MAG: sugar ABC transporter substrate-binding protein [Bacillus thermozeamaize]|uniref:Sugar ABC transporter substrate-binding protein n=1 Tax=Bacillus thermozeamaize TaxID=230954 RepID=A0A1Y3PI12_9BACI|nr:MAG: sugar ABC transporter substrate-binding protein [Bacillus thermozeamaize]
MKKASLILASVFLLTGVILSACGGNGEKNETQAQGAQESQNAEAREVTLKLFIPQPRLKDQYDAFIAKFVEKEKRDKNITVKVQLEMPNAENAPQILKTRLASNDAPDVFTVHAINEIPTFYKAGYLEDLSDQPFVDKLLDSVRASVTIDGKVVGVPMETLMWGYLYNKKIFADLGLTPPMTLSEMKQVVEKLKANNITPFLLTYKESWMPQLFLPLSVGALVNTENPDFIDRMYKNEGSFAEMKAMFEIIDLVNANGTDRAMEIGPDEGSAHFAQGKAAMWVNGPWHAETILKADPNFEFGVAPLPINDNPDATMINLSTSTTFVVSPTSKNKDVALDFINYILDDEVSNEFYQSLKFNPVAKNHTFESYPWVNEASEYVKAGKAYQDPSIPQAVKDESGKVLQAYYTGQATQDDVIAALDKAWQDFNKINNQ